MSTQRIKRKKLRKIQVVFQVFLIVFLFFTSFSSSIVSAETTNSNDYRRGMINLGKGIQDFGGDTGALESLTGDQLKTLGVFISNYYVPFSTQVGRGRNEEETEAIKTQMVQSLTETGNFTKDIADIVVEAVLEVSSKPQPLYFGYSSNGGKSYKSAKTGDTNGRQATFYEFLDQVSGYAYKSEQLFKGQPLAYPPEEVLREDGGLHTIYNDPNWGYRKGESNRGVMYWDSGDGSSMQDQQIVFDWIPDSNLPKVGQTASQTVMAMIYKYLDTENSVGTSFLDYTKDERGGAEKDTISSLIKELDLYDKSIQPIYERSMYDWTMWVDAFGNILVDTGVRQYVVVPAAMNPYVFKKTTEDEGDLEFGRSLPLNNLMSITLASQGNLLSDDTNPTEDEAKLDIGNLYSNFPKTENDNGYFNVMYKFPGTKDRDWNEDSNYFLTEKGYDWGTSTLDALTTQYGLKMWDIEKPDMDDDKWLNFKDKANNVERHRSYYKVNTGRTFLYNLFPYGFNTSTKVENSLIAPKSGLNSTPSHYIIQDLVTFDSFGILTNDTYVNEDVTSDDQTIMRTRIWDDKGETEISTDGITKGSAFGEKLEPERNKLNVASNAVMKDYSSNLYVSYVLAGLGGQDIIGYQIGFGSFPTFNGGTVLENLDPESQMKINDQELKNMAYYFLHPTEGVDYFARWAKTKIGALLVGWHNDMTGASNATNTTGMTKYIGFSGFTTMPSLNDLEWTSWMSSTYLSWGIYLIIGMVLIMLLYTVMGEVSMQKAILGVAVFSICLYLPPTAINSTVGVTNAISDSVYSNKFLHWGVMQLQTYSDEVDKLAEAGSSGDELDYTQSLLALQGGGDGMYSTNSSLGNGVTLKWMTPKKDNYLSTVQEELESSTNSEGLASLTDGLLRRTLSGETYLDSNNAVYLYRTFQDITNYSRLYYGNLMGDNVFGRGTLSHDISDISESLATVGMQEQYSEYLSGTDESSLYNRKKLGFINDEQDGLNGSSTNKNVAKRIYAPLSSKLVSDTANLDISTIGVGDKVGVSSDYLQATVKNFNNHEQSLSTQLSSDVLATELASTSSYALYTESPYYYFSWSLYDNGMSTKSGSSGSFRELMLGDNDSFFYNYDIDSESSGYGAMKDYFDMGSMFTTVIPYLKTLNAPVKQWGDTYGTEPYLDVSVKEEDAGIYSDESSESYYKYWHNVNLGRLYNTYTAWVDAMYDSKYAKPEKIEYGGESQVVSDPINPESYEVRPMVFSETEMEYYGLKDYDLTTVESKILKVQKETRNDLLQLLNYAEFDDVVLNSTASMIMTFNFNKEFSQNNFVNESFVQYPQGFELKNFTYDAYLRLILSNGTGESLTDMNSDTNVYERVVEKSSILTGIVLVIGDAVSVYLIPVMKFLFLILVFVLSVLAIFVKATRIEVSFTKVLWTSLLKPLVMFGAVTIGHSVIISLFMSNGVTDVTGDTSVTISLGDPTMTLIILLIINLIVLVLYGLIIYGLIKEVIVYGKIASSVLTGVFASTFSYGGSKLKQAGSTISGYGSGGSATPPSSSYTSNPEERGKNNVSPESTVLSDLRTREINKNTYRDRSEDTNDDQVGIESAIERGRERVKGDDYSNDLNDIADSSSQSIRTKDTLDKRNELESSKDSDDSDIDGKRKHAEDMKKKYDLD